MLTGVTVLGDFLRPDGRGLPGGADAPTTWLFDAIKRQVRRASGLSVSLITPGAVPELAGALAALRPAESADILWAEGFSAVPGPVARSGWLEQLVLSRLRDTFCVGWELPPGIVGLLDANGIPWLDLRIHPVRFLDDLLFAVSAAHADTRAWLADAAADEGEVLVTAGLREAMCRLIARGSLPPDTLVVVGQRPFDSSQIVGGRFFDASTHLDTVNAICAGYSGIVLKPHPLERDHGLLLAAARAPTRVLGVVGDNIYRLLSLPEVAAVLTVNSSVAYEAGYFGKVVHTLAPLPIRVAWRGAAPDAGWHFSQSGSDVLSIDFWRSALTPHTAVTPRDGVRLPEKPNRLRIALDSFWGFQEIDTDRIPRTDAAVGASPAG